MKESDITSQPTPRPSTDGGIGVALPNLDAAMNVPVDCTQCKGQNLYQSTSK